MNRKTIEKQRRSEMKLTNKDINKAYSEQLAKLLQEGYEFSVARENGSLKTSEMEESSVLLEKNEQEFVFGFSYEYINRKVGKYVLTLTTNLGYGAKENKLENPYIYYFYNFVVGYEDLPYSYFAFSTEEEAIELYEKRKRREEYKKWLRSSIINTFKVPFTKYQGFRKDVTVISREQSYTLNNKNGRKGHISKSSGNKWMNNLKKA